MLNRHAIVLFLGNAALLLVRPPPPAAYAPMGAWFLCLLAGLLLDTGQPGPRANLAHGLQLAAVALLLVHVARVLPTGSEVLHVSLCELGISVAVVGLLVEMRAPYRLLRAGVGIQAVGDAVFLGAFLSGLWTMTVSPSRVGWVFIAIAGLLSFYAAVSNLILQLARLRNPQAGWRFRVSQYEGTGLLLKTPEGEARLPWQHIRAMRRLDRRHLILVLPSPLPPELTRIGLPLDELRAAEEPQLAAEQPPPEAYGLILHEQELGRPLPEAELALRAHVPASA